MSHSSRRFAVAAAVLSLIGTLNVNGQSPAPGHQGDAVLAARRERVDLLKEEIKEDDARIESRIDTIVETLRSITDTHDSRTKVARMKEDAMKRLGKTITYYDQKRAALKEELRNPRLMITAEEKHRLIEIYDERIETRIAQILALNKSMPAHEDHPRSYNNYSGWNEEYNQNTRMNTRNNAQQDAIVKQLEASIARLDRQSRSLKAQSAAATDPVQRKALRDELAKTNAMLDERRHQRLEVLKPTQQPAERGVSLNEAMDLDKAMQTANNDLRRDMDFLFQRYNTLLIEVSNLHAAEAAARK